MAIELIIQMHGLSFQTKLNLILKFSKNLNPEFQTFLPEVVKKFDRYYSISCEFVCVVRNKKYFIFNSITIKTFSILRLFQSLNVNKNFHFFTTLQSIFRSENTVQSKSFQSFLKKCLKKLMQMIFDKFRLTIANYYKFVKLHAKIQLFFFYELNSEKIRSKIICSNKNAYYLYDFFFKFHDQYSVFKIYDCFYHR